MTSRNPQCGLLATACGHEELDSLEEPECVQVLQQSAKLSEVAYNSEDYAFAVTLVKRLGHHTLAILHAGSYIATKHCSVADYLDFFQTNRRRLLETSRGQGQPRYDTVYATFGASIEFLEQQEAGVSEKTRKDALKLIEFLSTFHYMSVPLDVLEDAWEGVQEAVKTPKEFETYADNLTAWHVAQVPDLVRTEKKDVRIRITEAVARLESLALVKTDRSARAWKSVSMHPLVHCWVRDRQNEQERNSAVRMTVYIVALSNLVSHGWHPYYHQFRLHLKLLVESDVELVNDAAQSRCILQACVQIAWFYHLLALETSMYEFTGRIFQRLGLHDQEPTEDLRGLYQAFGVAVKMGEIYPAQTLRTFEAIAHLDEKTRGENDLDRLQNMSDLASAYHQNARTKEAIALLGKVVKAYQELPEEDEGLCSAQHGLGVALLDDGQIKEAITLLEKLVKIRQRLSIEDPTRLAAQQVLAVAYVQDGQVAEATRRLEDVARIHAQALEEHPYMVMTQNWLAIAYQLAGRLSEAIALWERVVNTPTHVLPGNHPNLMLSQHNLASAYLDTGRIQEATNVLQRVVNIQNSTLDDTSRRKRSSQNLLAQAYLGNNEGSKAISILEQVVDVGESIFKNTDRQLLVCRYDLARALLTVGRTSEAIKILEIVVDIEKSRCDEKDLNGLVPQQLLAREYLNAGRNSEAVRVLEQVVEVEALLYDEGDPRRIASEELLDEARVVCDRSSSTLTKTSLSPAENAQSNSVVRHSRKPASGKSNHRPDVELEENECGGSNEMRKVMPLINSRTSGRWAGRLRTRPSCGRLEVLAGTHPVRKRKRPE